MAMIWDSDPDGDRSDEDSLDVPVHSEPHFLLHILTGRFDGSMHQGSSAQMEASMWSRLPQGVLEMILATLPPASRFRFQAVCKRWQALLSSKSFLIRSAALVVPNSEPVIGAIEYRPANWGRKRPHHHSHVPTIFRQALSTRLSLAFLPKRFRYFNEFVTQDGLACIIKPARMRALARSGNGNSVAAGSSSVGFCVVNPVTRTWEEMPPEFARDEPYTRDWRVKLVAGGGAGSRWYNVIVMSNRSFRGDSRLTVTLYCSRMKAWKRIPLELGLRDDYFPYSLRWSCPHYLLCNGLLYSLGRFNHFAVQSVEDGKVVRRFPESEFHAAYPDRRYHDMGDVCEMLEHGGNIFGVGESVDRDQCMRCGIWKLDQSSLMWDKVSVLPDRLGTVGAEMAMDRAASLNQTIKISNCTLIDALVVGDCICLTLGLHIPEVGQPGVLSHLIAYNIPEDTWHLIQQDLHCDYSGIPYRMFSPAFHVVPETPFTSFGLGCHGLSHQET